MSIYDSEKNQMTQIEEDATKRNLENIQRVLYTTRMSNRIEPDVFHKIKMRIVQEMSAVIETTLGPYGSKILLQPKGQHGIVSYATKDGWECLNNMSYPYDDPIPHAIMFIVNDIPNSMNFHIGDGTTSGVPIVRRLYELVHEKFIKRTSHNRISPVGMTNLLNAIEEHLKENCVGLKKENEKIEYEEDGKTIKNISVDYNYNSKYIKQMDNILFDSKGIPICTESILLLTLERLNLIKEESHTSGKISATYKIPLGYYYLCMPDKKLLMVKEITKVNEFIKI